MAAISDNDIISRLAKLNITHADVVRHAPVTGGAEWKAELEKLSKTGVSLTKTVRAGPILTSSF